MRPENWYKLSVEKRRKDMEHLLLSEKGENIIRIVLLMALTNPRLDPALLSEIKKFEELTIKELLLHWRDKRVHDMIGQVLKFCLDVMEPSPAQFAEDPDTRNLVDLLEHLFPGVLPKQ